MSLRIDFVVREGTLERIDNRDPRQMFMGLVSSIWRLFEGRGNGLEHFMIASLLPVPVIGNGFLGNWVDQRHI